MHRSFLALALASAVILPLEAMAQVTVKEMTFPGTNCEVVTGSAVHDQGGVTVESLEPSLISCPIPRRNLSTASRTVTVMVRDQSPVGAVSCTLNALNIDPVSGEQKLAKTPALLSVGSSAKVQALTFDGASEELAVGADGALFLECVLSARFGNVNVMSYSAEVLD